LYFALAAQQLSDWMKQFACQYGYFGVFLVSLIGAVSIVFPIPYTLIIYMLGTILDPFLIAIAAGLGSGLGEIFGYIMGYYGRAAISEERQRKIDFMLKVFNRYPLSITIFFFALTPLPDDLLFIPLGIMRYNIVKVFVPAVLGKTLMSFILAIGGQLSIGIIRDMLGGGGELWTTIATAVLLVVIIAIMLKVDWEKVFTQYIEKSENKE